MSTATDKKAAVWRWLHRGSAITLVAAAVVSAIAFAATYFVLGTERGTQWALQTTHRLLPELSFVNAQGSLLHGVHVDRVRWRDADVDVDVDRAQLRLRFSSLLHGAVRLTMLHAEKLRITVLGESSSGPVELPRLLLPFALSTPDLVLQHIEIANGDSTVSLHDVRARVHWRATTLKFSNARVSWQNAALSTDGSIGFRNDYPLRARGKLTLPQWPGAIDVTSAGNLRRLELDVRSEKPYAASAHIELATLDKDLPLSISAKLHTALQRTLGDERIAVETATLKADGDLTQIEAHLAIALVDSRYGKSKLSASVRWHDDKVHVDAQWLPSTGNLQLRCDGALQKPLGATCSGDAKSIALTPWLPGETGEISGPISLEAHWLDPQWKLMLSLPDLRGTYDSETLQGAIDLRTNDGALWQLQRSKLAIGANTLSADGELGSHYHLKLGVDARNLAQFDARAGGSISGTVAIDGDAAPNITAHLRGSKLRWGDSHAASGSAALDVAQLGAARSSARISVQQFSHSALSIADLTLGINGTRRQQSWTARAEQAQNNARLQCSSQADTAWEKWRMTCNEASGRLQLSRRDGELSWHNTVALQASIQPTKNILDFEPFCLRGNDTELCLDRALHVASGRLQPFAAHASGVPLRWARRWFPDTVELLDDARASAQLNVRSLAPLEAAASITLPATHWRWSTLTASKTAALDPIHFDAKLNAQHAYLATSIRAPSIGRLSAQLTVNDPTGKRELDGRIAIEPLQLSGIAWAFSGLDAISGDINGAVDITGTAAKPRLHGQLLLKDGSALWAPLGAPFRTVHADLTFDNNSAKLGGWFALGDGGGDIDGTLEWDDTEKDWQLQVNLVAGGLSAVPLPDSTVVFSPHVQLNAKPHEVHIDGYVDIASADIHFQQLPPDTVDVSPDQQIVGQSTAADTWKLWANLGLNLGDKFRLRGFGADVDLGGKLLLRKMPGDNMHLYGQVSAPHGRYRAYGQRLSVRKGNIIFNGPIDNPELNLEAVRDMPPGVTDVVGLRVLGSLKAPEAVLFSEPAMPDSEIAYYLLTGRKPTSTATTENGYSASGALLSLGLAGSESKAGQLAEKFGISDLQLGTGESSTGQSEAEVSGQLSKDLYVRYGRGLGQQSNSISFQYRLTPKLIIETISGIEDSLDLLYSFEVK